MIRKVPELKKDMTLDIGCSTTPLKGYVGMDVRDCGQPIIWDARQGIPYPDNSIKDIRSSHFLEHLTDEESIDFLQDVLRVLKKGGHFYCHVPHQEHPTAYYYGHKTFWNEWRIDSTLRLTEKLPPFKITKNQKEGTELVFTLEKI